MPLTAFYEWQKIQAPASKRSHAIRPRDHGLLDVAVLWTIEKAPEGVDVDSCTILTTSPNDLMAPLHDRMPAILLTADEREAWLDPATPVKDAHALLQPCDPDGLEAYRVSDAVGNAKNDNPQLLEPIEA